MVSVMIELNVIQRSIFIPFREACHAVIYQDSNNQLFSNMRIPMLYLNREQTCPRITLLLYNFWGHIFCSPTLCKENPSMLLPIQLQNHTTVNASKATLLNPKSVSTTCPWASISSNLTCFRSTFYFLPTCYL